MPPINIVVTSYDNYEELQQMYEPAIQRTIKDLLKNGCKLFY